MSRMQIIICGVWQLQAKQTLCTGEVLVTLIRALYFDWKVHDADHHLT